MPNCHSEEIRKTGVLNAVNSARGEVGWAGLAEPAENELVAARSTLCRFDRRHHFIGDIEVSRHTLDIVVIIERIHHFQDRGCGR